MTIPALIFAFLIASLLGALYHLIRGGGFGKLLLNLILSWIGFMLGYFLGVRQGWSLFPMGEIDLGTSIPASLILLVGADLISRIRIGSATFSDGDNGV